jgi:Protein of unknown function (DUF1091)
MFYQSSQINVETLRVDYTNPKYVSNYTIKKYVDDKNGSRIFLSFRVNTNLTILLGSGVLKGKTSESHDFRELLKGSVDFCNLSNNFLGQTAIQFYARIWENYGNYTPKCPLLVGFYYVDVPLDEIKVPAFIPRIDGEFSINAVSKMKISKRKTVKLWDASVTGTVKF